MLLYEECYKRNIGLFTETEQKKLKDAKIVVAGVGGVGGIETATLAKMGVCNFIIFDPGEFDPPDMNRQLGATASNIGKNKAIATKELILEINPFAKVEALNYAPESDEELDDLLKDATVAIDAIDYIGFDYKVKFAKAVRRAGIYNFTAPILGMTTSVFIFDPKGMSLEEFYSAPKDEKKWNAYKIPLDKVMHQGSSTSLAKDFIYGKTSYLSNCAGTANLNGGLVASEIALLITGKRDKKDLICAPKTIFFDIIKRNFIEYEVKV